MKKERSVADRLRNGSRRGRHAEVRAEIVRGLGENYGMPIADIVRQAGISTSRGFEDPDESPSSYLNSVP
jgi:hypothetical protein